MMADTEQELFPILDEDATEQRIIPFEGDELTAARSIKGDIYITVPGICKALGLNTQAQTRRLQRTPMLAKGLRRISLKTGGGIQAVTCLRLDRIALWIAGIETDRIKPIYRAKIEAYQDELAPVATRLFMQVLGSSSPFSTTDPRMAALAEQYDVLMSAATFISEHMDELAGLPGQVQGVSDQLAQAVRLLESLAAQQETTSATMQEIKQEQKLTPAQKQGIQDAVSHIVRDSTGKPGELTYAQVYAGIYRRFHVSSYSEILAAKYEEVLKYLRGIWKQATTGTLPEQKSLF